MCGGSKGTNTTTTTTTPPADVLAAYRNVMGKAQSAANLPYTGAPVDIAGFTPDQMNAFQSVNNAQGMSVPFFNTAANYGGIGGANISDQTPLLSDNTNAQLASSAANQFSSWTPNYMMSALAALPMLMNMTGAGLSPYGGMPPGTYAPPQSSYSQALPPGTYTGSMGALPPGVSGGSLSDVTGGMVPNVDASTISQYMSPYTQSVVDATQKQFANQNEQARQGLIGNAISAGAWGGDRAGIAQAELANQQQLAQAPVIAGLYNQGYGQALSEANQQQQTGLAKAGLSLQQLQALGQLGLGQQQTDISRMGTTGQLGLGQENYGLGLMGTSGQLSLGQQGVGLNQANQALQALQLGMSGNQSQDQAALQRAQLAAAMYGQNAQLANQSAYQSGQLGLGAGQLFGNLGMNAQQAALAAASAQLQTGGMQQQLQQEWNNVQNANYMAAQQWPFTTSQFLAGIAGSMAGGMGGTSTQATPKPSLLSQLGGLGMTGLGVIGGTGGFGATGWLTGLLRDGGRVGLDAGGRTPGGPITEENVLRRTAGHAAAPNVPQLPPGIPVTAGTPGSMAAVPNFNGAGINFNGAGASPPPAPPAGIAGADVSPPQNGLFPLDSTNPNFLGPDTAASVGTQPLPPWSPALTTPHPAPPFYALHHFADGGRLGLQRGGWPDDEDDDDDDGLNMDLMAFNPAYARAAREDKEQMQFTGVSPVNDAARQAVFHAPDLPTVGSGISAKPLAPPAGIPDTSDGTSSAIAAAQNKPMMPAMAEAPAPAQDPQMDGAIQAAQAAGEAGNEAVADEKGKKKGSKTDGWDSFTNSPWMALVAAGLGTMAGTSPDALVNFGTGGEQALKVIKDQRVDRERRETAEARLKVLQQNADLNAKRFLEAKKQNDPANVEAKAKATARGTRAGQIDAGPTAAEQSTAVNRPLNPNGTVNQAYVDAQVQIRKAARADRPDTYTNAQTVEVDDPKHPGGRMEVLAQQDKHTLQWVSADETKTPLAGVTLPGGGPSVVSDPNPDSGSILAQTGLSMPAFAVLTGGAASLDRARATRGPAYKQAEDWANKRGIDISTFASQYEALNKVVKSNVERVNATRSLENEMLGTLDNLEPVANKAGLGSLNIANVARLYAGQQFNDPVVSEYALQLGQLRHELAGYNAALQGRTTAGSITDSDNKSAEQIIMNGLSAKGAGGLRKGVTASAEKMGKVLKGNLDLSRKDVWDLFGVGDNFKGAKEPTAKPAPTGGAKAAPAAAAPAGAVPVPKGAANDPDGTPYKKGGVDYVKKGDFLVPLNAPPADAQNAAPKAAGQLPPGYTKQKALDEARAALKGGPGRKPKDKAAVDSLLRSMGIDPAELGQ